VSSYHSWLGRVLLLAYWAPLAAQPQLVIEASGVTRRGDSLLVVDDSAIGAYFRVPVPPKSGMLMPLNRQGTQRMNLVNAVAVDLEGIDSLADGRIAFLSERMRSLIGRSGIIVEYEGDLSEFAKRGLEGVAVRPLAGAVSRIAIVWEGGYPDYPSVPALLRGPLGRKSMPARVVIHDLQPRERGKRLRLRDALQTVELDLPVMPGVEPDAQRFRVPDLVWYLWPGSEQPEWGFLMLMSSQNSVEKPHYMHHWLQRFNMSGKRIGDPLDLAEFLPPKVSAANWEGLSWFEPGKSVVMVHEGERDLPPNAFVLELPASWRFGGATASGNSR